MARGMSRIELTTEIRAPIERCFDLARSIDLHLASGEATRERAVAGVTRGLIALGEQVTWRARHFGIYFRLTSRITDLERPAFFRDRMVEGPFTSFEHDHAFESTGGVTLMHDDLRFAAPLGPLGRLADALLLRRHLRRFITERNATIKRVAETSGEWRRYLGS